MSGRPATRTIGLLTRKPSARSRLPAPAAMMPPCRIGHTDLPVISGSPPDRPSRAMARMIERLLGCPDFGGLYFAGRDPDESHANAPCALAVAEQRIADEQGRLGLRAKRLERSAEDRRIGFLGTDPVAVDDDPEQGRLDRRRDTPLRGCRRNSTQCPTDIALQALRAGADCARRPRRLRQGSALQRARRGQLRDDVFAAPPSRRASSASRLVVSRCTVLDRSASSGKSPTNGLSAA